MKPNSASVLCNKSRSRTSSFNDFHSKNRSMRWLHICFSLSFSLGLLPSCVYFRKFLLCGMLNVTLSFRCEMDSVREPFISLVRSEREYSTSIEIRSCYMRKIETSLLSVSGEEAQTAFSVPASNFFIQTPHEAFSMSFIGEKDSWTHRGFPVATQQSWHKAGSRNWPMGIFAQLPQHITRTLYKIKGPSSP